MNRKKNKKDYALTISGNEILKVNCILINKQYYEKNVDCFLINYKGSDKWIPYDNSYCFNFTNGQYEKKKELEEKDLKSFLIGFGGKNSEKLIFGYDIPNFALNVHVLSHHGNINNEISTYSLEVKRSKERMLKLNKKLDIEEIFRNNYDSFVNVLCILYYYRHFINTDYSYEDLDFANFDKILKLVEDTTHKDEEVKNSVQEFYSDYRSYVNKNYSGVSPIEDPDNKLNKLSFEIVHEDKNLVKIFEFFIKRSKLTTAIQNEIEVEKLKIVKYEERLKELEKLNFFNSVCRNKEEALKLGFVESFENDSYYLKKNLTENQLKQLSRIPQHNEQGSYSKNIKINYNVNNETTVFNNILSKYILVRENNIKFDKKSYNIAKLLKGLTFGVEFETSLGRIREPDLYKHGVIPLRDGSVAGFEYTTIPYGYSDVTLNQASTQALSKDLVNLKELCTELSNRCLLNSFCSMHIHIGNVRKDKLYLLAVYMLCYLIQDEMFEMFPKFKEDSPKYLGTQKNYCKKLDHLGLFNNCIFDKSSVLKETYCDNVNLYFNKIFKFLSDGQEIGSKFNRKCLKHPIERKWERHGRYHWVNLVNSVFSNSRTIEFRLHTATLNFTKTLNWILICSAIVKYADTHTKEIISGKISKITLYQILEGYTNNFRDKKDTNEMGLFIHKYLEEYIENRKAYFADKTLKKDYVCEREISEDKKYKFQYKGITDLI